MTLPLAPALRVFVSTAALSLAGIAGLGGCFIDREYSDQTVIEFEACATFGDKCDDLTSFQVVGRELGQKGEASIGEKVRFLDVTPNEVVTFDVEGYAGDTLLYKASCDIGATPYTTVEADCRDHVEAETF